MKETTINRQTERIFLLVLENLKEKVPQNIYDNIFGDGSFDLKSLDGGKAVFVSDSESSAQLIKALYLTPLTNILHDVTSDEYEVEVTDRASYSRRKIAVEDASARFFQNSHLSPAFQFDNFVVGSNNKAAYQAGLFAVAKPGVSNPIFLYSKSGMGKTHLLLAIGNAYKEQHPDSNVLYITSDDFIEEFVKYSKGLKDNENLKDFFSTIDMLLVDDIQFLADKDKTQTMFFNVFNLLVGQGKQIVLTSDKSPMQLSEMGDEHLQDRLVSRFSGGLSISITTPARETMIEILKMKIRNNGLDLSLFAPEVLEYLANNYSTNVRVLEGAFTKVLFEMTIEKPQGKITLPFVKFIFEDDESHRKMKGKVSVEEIISIVSDYYSLTSSQLKSKVRTSQIALARQIAMYLSRKVLSLPYQEIGKAFGKDHTTVLANVQKIESMKGKDTRVETALLELKKTISKESSQA